MHLILSNPKILAVKPKKIKKFKLSSRIKFLSTKREISRLPDQFENQKFTIGFNSTRKIFESTKHSQSLIKPVIKESQIEKLIKERANSLANKAADSNDRIPELKNKITKIKIEVDSQILDKIKNPKI